MPKASKRRQLPAKQESGQLTSSMIRVRLQTWASAGTEEGIRQLEKFIATESQRELRDLATLALGDAQYKYYAPHSEAEEEQYLLAKMCHKRQKKLMKKISEAKDVKYSLRKVKLEEKVRVVVVKKANPAQKKEWGGNMDGYVYEIEYDALKRLENEIAYESAWLVEARKMITLKKYQDIHPDIFEHLILTGEKGSYWTDTMPTPSGFPCNDSCGGCSDCQRRMDWDDEEIKIEDIPF